MNTASITAGVINAPIIFLSAPGSDVHFLKGLSYVTQFSYQVRIAASLIVDYLVSYPDPVAQFATATKMNVGAVTMSLVSASRGP